MRRAENPKTMLGFGQGHDSKILEMHQPQIILQRPQTFGSPGYITAADH